MKFHFKALNSEGKSVSETREASDRFQMLNQLKADGFTVLHLEESEGKEKADSTSPLVSGKHFLSSFSKIKPKIITLFTRQLCDLCDAGIPILEGIASLRKNSSNEKFEKVLEDVESRIRQGENFSQALEAQDGVFDPIYIGMIKAGESSGQVSEVLDGLAKYQERDQELRSQIRAATFYPLFTLGFSAVLCYLLVAYLLPGFEPIWHQTGLDLTRYPVTEFLLSLSDITHSVVDEILLVVALLLVVVAFKRLTSTAAGKQKSDSFWLKVPVFGSFVKMGVFARSLNTMGTMIHAGIPTVKALEMSADTAGNEVLAEAFRNVSKSVKEGQSLTDAFSSAEAFPPMLIQMLGVGESSGKLETMLPRIAGYYDRQLQDSLKTLTSVLEPATMILVGGIVFVFVIGVFLPIMGIVQSISH